MNKEAANKKLALIIGVREYQNPAAPILDAATKDALSMKQSLLRYGFESANIRILSDSKATAKDINSGLKWLEKEGVGATIFFFFSGHGYYERGGAASGYYICSSDFDPAELLNSDAEKVCNLNQVTKSLMRTNAQQLAIYLDCCHAGGIFDSLSFFSQFDTIKNNVPNLSIFASSQASERSFIMPGSENSLFTAYLLEALGGKASPSTRPIVTSADIANYVGERVPQSSPDQHTFIHTSGKTEIVPNLLYKDGRLTRPASMGSLMQAFTDERWLNNLSQFLIERLREEKPGAVAVIHDASGAASSSFDLFSAVMLCYYYNKDYNLLGRVIGNLQSDSENSWLEQVNGRVLDLYLRINETQTRSDDPTFSQFCPLTPTMGELPSPLETFNPAEEWDRLRLADILYTTVEDVAPTPVFQRITKSMPKPSWAWWDDGDAGSSYQREILGVMCMVQGYAYSASGNAEALVTTHRFAYKLLEDSSELNRILANDYLTYAKSEAEQVKIERSRNNRQASDRHADNSCLLLLYATSLDEEATRDDYQNIYGSILYYSGQIEQAEEEWRKALDVGSGYKPNVTTYFNLGVARLTLGDADQAGFYFEKALELDKTRLDALFGCIQAETAKPQEKRKYKYIEAKLKLLDERSPSIVLESPNVTAATLLAVGKCWFRLREYAKANVYFEPVMQVKNPVGWVWYWASSMMMGEGQKVYDLLCDEVILKGMDNPIVCYFLAGMAAMKKDHRSIVQALDITEAVS